MAFLMFAVVRDGNLIDTFSCVVESEDLGFLVGYIASELECMVEHIQEVTLLANGQHAPKVHRTWYYEDIMRGLRIAPEGFLSGAFLLPYCLLALILQ